MWLQTPDTIIHVLVESQLEPVGDAVLDQATRGWHSHGETVSPGDALRTLPVVSIGQPETWSLVDLYPPRKLPLLIRARLSQADFYLVRLSCSFRPLHKESRIQWARFRAVLLPHPASGKQPLAFDIYPQQVVQEVKRHLKVTLSPMLKFQELEANLGSAEFGFEYTELVPLISATMGGSFDPMWDYTAASGQAVQGTKWMYLLVKAPKGLASGQALLELNADVLVKGTRLPVVLRHQQEQVSAQISVPLWG